MSASSDIAELLPSKGLLDPVDRISELLFGLIMALGFTGAVSAATAAHEEIRTMLIAALGCNLAWGIVDAVMYLMTQLTQQGRALRMLRAARNDSDPDGARRVIAAAFPPKIAAILRTDELEALRLRLRDLPEPAPHALLQRSDLLAALAVCLLVFFSTFPVALPFLLMHHPLHAMRVSNLIAVVMMFLCGHRLGTYGGHHPWLMGISMAVLGGVLVALTIALGG